MMVFAVISSLRLVHYLNNGGLSSSWGTSWIRPAWSPFEHQLTPALSPIWGPRPKPRRPEEVVYSPNYSCSHFTQRLFPPKLPQQHICTIFSIHSPSFILIIHHIQATFTSFYYESNHSIISSALHSRPTALGLFCPIQKGLGWQKVYQLFIIFLNCHWNITQQ
jgi:hypothetical protein